MSRNTRRDFLDGIALAVAAGMPPARLFAQYAHAAIDEAHRAVGEIGGK